MFKKASSVHNDTVGGPPGPPESTGEREHSGGPGGPTNYDTVGGPPGPPESTGQHEHSGGPRGPTNYDTVGGPPDPPESTGQQKHSGGPPDPPESTGQQKHSGVPPDPPESTGQQKDLGGPGGPPTQSPSPYFDPHSSVNPREHRVPHWHQDGVYCGVTWRMGDSLPKVVLDEWRAERAAWLAQNPEPWSESTELEYFDQFSRRMDTWLDQGRGSCPFRDPALARIVGDTIQHFDGERYDLVCYVVMPNHVHVLFRPINGHRIGTIVKSWKSFSAREVNKRLGRTGSLWMDDYWDRLIRNSAHFEAQQDYILRNPAVGKLRKGEFLLYER